MADWILLGALAFLGAFTVWRELLHDRRERDLLDRLMSRDVTDLQTLREGKTAPPAGRSASRAMEEREGVRAP